MAFHAWELGCPWEYSDARLPGESNQNVIEATPTRLLGEGHHAPHSQFFPPNP